MKIQDIKSTYRNQLTNKILINSAKKVKDLYNENYKALMKELEEYTNGKISHVHKSED